MNIKVSKAPGGAYRIKRDGEWHPVRTRKALYAEIGRMLDAAPHVLRTGMPSCDWSNLFRGKVDAT